jgi:hypothetical protein
VPDDEAEGDLRVGGWLPNQRSESSPDLPGWAAHDQTQVLPAFLTGGLAEKTALHPTVDPAAVPAKAPAVKPVTPPAADGDKLPSSERNMLIFVALLLAVGTLAVVTVMGIGALTRHDATPTPTPSSSTR